MAYRIERFSGIGLEAETAKASAYLTALEHEGWTVVSTAYHEPHWLIVTLHKDD
jgi:hypothetical protein